MIQKKKTYKMTGCKEKKKKDFPNYHLGLIYDRGKSVLKEITLGAETLMETGISRNVIARECSGTNVKCIQEISAKERMFACFDSVSTQRDCPRSGGFSIKKIKANSNGTLAPGGYLTHVWV